MQQVILVSPIEFNNLKLRIIQAKKKDNVKYEWTIFNLEAHSAERIELGKLAQPKLYLKCQKKCWSLHVRLPESPEICPYHCTRITVRHSQICKKTKKQ